MSKLRYLTKLRYLLTVALVAAAVSPLFPLMAAAAESLRSGGD